MVVKKGPLIIAYEEKLKVLRADINAAQHARHTATRLGASPELRQ